MDIYDIAILSLVKFMKTEDLFQIFFMKGKIRIFCNSHWVLRSLTGSTAACLLLEKKQSEMFRKSVEHARISLKNIRQEFTNILKNKYTRFFLRR